MARQRRTPNEDERTRGDAGEAPARQGERYGPRGGLAGASDDFADYLHEDEYRPRDAWDGWSTRGVYGRGAREDHVDRGPELAPAREERRLQDYRGYDEDLDYGGRDTAADYARRGGNAEYMERRRAQQRSQASAEGRRGRRGVVIDPRYDLVEGPRDFDAHYQPSEDGWLARRHLPDTGDDDAAWRDAEADALDAGRQDERQWQQQVQRRARYGAGRGADARDPGAGGGWPGRDFPEGRGRDRSPQAAAPGAPGLAEPSYGASPTRERAATARGADHRGRGPRVTRPDARIRDDLCERYTEDPWIDASDIAVRCENGTVILEGEVETRAMKHRAEDVADVCPGVADIDNRLKVRQRGVTRAEQGGGY